MTLRNVPKAHTLEQQRQEINLIASDLDTAVDGVKTFGGSKTFSGNVTFQSTVDFGGIALFNTSPTFNSSPTFSDNVAANFGDDADLKIYYDGSVGVLTSFIDSDALQIRSESDTSELYATFLKDGPVELYYNGAKKFGTNLTGATVLGDLEINDEIHSATGMVTFKVADEITPGNMITAAHIGGSVYGPYGLDTYNLSLFPSGGISETSDTSGFSVNSNGQIYISTGGASALWKGKQTGSTAVTSEINAQGNARFDGTLEIGGNSTFDGAVIHGQLTAGGTGGNYFSNGEVAAYGPSSSANIWRGWDASGSSNVLTSSISADGDATFAGTVDAAAFTVGGSAFVPDVATTSTVGTVKPDDDTIEVDANGEISCTGKLNWTSGSNFYPNIGVRKVEAVNTNTSFTQPTTDIQVARFANFGTQGLASQSVGSFGLTTKDTQVIIESFADSGGSPSIVFRSGGTNMVVGQLYAGTTDNKLVLGPGGASNTNPTQVTALTIDGLNNVEVNNLAISSQTNATGTTSVTTVLDHYEEGLYTPTLVGSSGGEATYGNQKGGYVRVGSLVHVYGYLSITDVNTISGTLRLGNFPFNTRNDNSYFHAPSFGWYVNLTGITAHGLGLDMAAGANSGAIIYGNGTGVTGLPVANVTNAFAVEWAFTYRTDD